MLPFAEYGVVDGDTVYLAIHSMHVDRIPLLLAAVPPSLTYLQRYRLMVILFDDHVKQIRLFDETSDVLDFPLRPWSGESGGHIDPVVGIVLTDHASYHTMKRPVLFLFCDGNLATHWNLGIIAQAIQAVWLHELSDAPVLTPFGVRRLVNLEEEPHEDQPGGDRQQPD